MAFVCTLNDDWIIAATTLQLQEGQGEYIVRVPIGYDDRDNSAISAVICLATEPGYGDLRYELVFQVTRAGDDDEPEFFSDGLETRELINDAEHRRRIMIIITMAVEQLIDQVAPAAVVMSTHEANLPPKALVKYETICNAFSRNGYRAGRADPYHGLQIWMMVKL